MKKLSNKAGDISNQLKAVWKQGIEYLNSKKSDEI